MSNVKIQGNISGTGTFTITAPNTDSDFAFELPAASGTFSVISPATNNGVVYINGSGVPTSGSALVFDGTNLGIGTSSPGAKLDVNGDALVYGITVGRGAGAVSTNTAVGADVLVSNTTGSENVAAGIYALYDNTTGYNNTAIGKAALTYNTTGWNNTAVGHGAMSFGSTGVANTAVGQASLVMTSGANNTAIGKNAGYLITTGSKNTILGGYNGNQGGLDIRTSDGYIVLSDGDGNPRQVIDENGHVGFNAVPDWSSTLNVLQVGDYTAVYDNTVSGSPYSYFDNNFTQTGAGDYTYLTSGYASAMILGNGGAFWYGSGGAGNPGDTIAMSEIMSVANDGSLNVPYGDATIYGITVGRGGGTKITNTALGSQALFYNTTGSYNTATGRYALRTNTTGAYNTAVGYYAGYSNSTGSYKTCLGYYAGDSSTGTGGLFLGNRTRPSSAANTHEMVLSSAGSTTFVYGKGSSTGYINANGGSIYQGNNSASWATTSDRRLKKNIVDNTDGLNKITAITVRNFEYRLPEEIDELEQSCAITKAGVQIGVIAQELQQVLPDCVREESTGVLAVDPDSLTWYMVNAIKELKAELDAAKAEIQSLKGN